MIVLAIDTSSAAVCAALVSVDSRVSLDEQRSGEVVVLAQRRTIAARAHGEQLAPSIAGCLAQADVPLAAVSCMVAGVGPGPFTGLRVGLMTAAAIGDAQQIPTYGVCSLDGIARALDEHAVLVATDARRHEVYWARYVDGKRMAGPAVCRPADVPCCPGDVIVGAGARRYADVFGGLVRDVDYPEPAALVRLAEDRITAGAASERLTPLYLRRPDAVVPGAPKPVTP